MKHKSYSGFSFSSKLILIYIILLSISSLTIGITGYLVARNELNRKGEKILKNSVIQAIDYIESEHFRVKSGLVSEEETKENIKETLMGPLDPETGFRILHHRIDLGENGYFIIYDSAGYEIMHPSLEGENVIDVVSFDDFDRYLVKEQIDTGKKGGGFTYYSWMLPHSDKIARKISYSLYYPPLDWIVVATAYEIDFNKAANIILLVIILTMLFLIINVSIIIIKYVKKLTKPIVAILEGMEKVAAHEYDKIDWQDNRDELGILIKGFNNMILSLREAEENIEEKEEYISYLAFNDDLTGLPNRHAIEAYITERIKKGCKAAFMIQADILGLKVINSTLGYKQGDHLLEIIGNYLSKINSSNLYLARTSSNEFTLWIENMNYHEIHKMVYELRDSVKEYINEEGYGQIIDLYVAMAVYPENGTDFGELYEKTSIAMKTAKDENNLQIKEYQDDFKKAVEDELSMRRYLSTALVDNEISAFYQAQVDYITGKVVGVEALARWNSKELGFVSPAVFIPAINSQNLVYEFSNYMMEKVMADYSRLKLKYNDDITVSINISPSFFMDRKILDNLNDLLKKYDIPPEKITLEITEDIFITDFEKIKEIMDDLHELGVRISIDDFGTGYSSLNYLTKINFDEMKIDKSFINKIIEEPKSMKLFTVLCRIAEIYGYDLVAEGVETELQLEKIKTTSLRTIQGYLFSKPEPIE